MASINLSAAASERRRWWIKTTGLALAAFFLFKLVLSFAFGEMGIMTFLDLHRMRRTLQQEITELRRDNDRLTDQVRALRSDPVYIEALAREQLGLVRPGEQVFRIMPSDNGAAPPARVPAPGRD